jgi:DNA-directed RNA polymerase subunit RPC12/RpoP
MAAFDAAKASIARSLHTDSRRRVASLAINLEKVRASLDAVCPKCGGLIPPAAVRRIDFEYIECPVCGERIVPVQRVNRGF